MVIVQMLYVRVIGLKQEMFEIIRTIRNTKVFHLVPALETAKTLLADEELHILQNNLQDIETRLTSVLANLSEPEEGLETLTEIELKDASEIVHTAEILLKNIEPKLVRIQTKLRQYQDHNQQIKKYKDILIEIHPLVREFNKVEGLESIVLILDKKVGIPYTVFEEKIKDITNGVYQLIRRNLDENFIAVLALFDREYLTDVQHFLFTERVSEMKLPPELQGIPVSQVSEKIQDAQMRNDQNISKLLNEKRNLQDSYYNDLARVHRQVQILLSEFDIVNRLNNLTEYSFELGGYIPVAKFNDFHKSLHSIYGDRIVVVAEKVEKDAPVLRKNPPFVRPFEIMADLLGLPVYGTIDPTILLFLLFTFFWGFMVGDVGYGLIFLGLTFVLPKIFPTFEKKTFKDIILIFRVSSISAIFFGLIYGEIFGDLGEKIFHIEPIFNRVHERITFMAIALLIGYFIILFGLALGIKNNLAIGKKKHARADLTLFTFWLVILIALGVVVLVPSQTAITILLLLLVETGLISILLYLDGISGLIHVIERFSNILSFARLMAIGLVGAEMANVANKIAAEQVFVPIFGEFIGILVGIFLMISLHIINILIFILSPSIHSLRLNVYEFFSQFALTGNVIKYKPYGQD
ncbi:MAG: V-type ATP synthase subunit I [Candidatus Hodarchaeales archaeon]